MAELVTTTVPDPELAREEWLEKRKESRESRKMRILLSCSTLLLCFVLIGVLLWWGNKDNPIHISALHWAFVLVAGILGAFGVPALTDLFRATSVTITTKP